MFEARDAWGRSRDPTGTHFQNIERKPIELTESLIEEIEFHQERQWLAESSEPNVACYYFGYWLECSHHVLLVVGRNRWVFGIYHDERFRNRFNERATNVKNIQKHRLVWTFTHGCRKIENYLTSTINSYERRNVKLSTRTSFETRHEQSLIVSLLLKGVRKIDMGPHFAAVADRDIYVDIHPAMQRGLDEGKWIND